ncbi:MAG TPA: hypothetical protein EYQ64_01385 [Gemmatimonadetes bacterium]|jgi:hypothetical protein|nr:hypothetical protein [Gemmatimonadota bacterium]
MIQLVQRHKRLMIQALILINYFFVVFVVGWNHYVEGDSWRTIVRMFDTERTPIAWFSSVQLLCVGFVAYATYLVTRLHDERRGETSAYRWIWPLLALGFVVLALDEFFMFHEQLRTRIMRPNDLLTNVPGFNPGDIGLFIPLIGGIAFAYFIVQALRPNLNSVRLFIAALVLITPLVILDAFHIGWIWDNLNRRFIQIVTEEIGENIAELLFLLSFLLVFFDRLGDLMRAPEPGEE